MRTVAIIVAAGKGERVGAKLPKQFLNIGNKPILAHTLEKFEKARLVNEVVVVVSEDYLGFCSREIIDAYEFGKIKRVVSGGKHRQDSVFNGLKSIDSNIDIVLIHDGARPFVKSQKIDQIIRACQKDGSTILALPIKETIKRVEKGKVITTLDRSKIWSVQTPQAFPYKVILDAYKKAKKDKFIATDDSLLVERVGIEVRVIEGDNDNIKITTIQDLEMAEYLVGSKYKG